MADIKPLTADEQDLLGQVCGFALRRADNGVYLNRLHSKSLNTPVLLVVALGEQAEALAQIIIGARVPDETPLIQPVKSLDDIGGPF